MRIVSLSALGALAMGGQGEAFARSVPWFQIPCFCELFAWPLWLNSIPSHLRGVGNLRAGPATGVAGFLFQFPHAFQSFWIPVGISSSG
jgi:hypothetical protein